MPQQQLGVQHKQTEETSSIILKEHQKKENEGDFFNAELEEGVEELNNTVEALHQDLKFELHESSGRMMVEVINLDNKEVIKEIPPREVLDMLGRIREMVGLLLDEKI
ncbi:flagellar biosynthesis protein FlaG [Iocasia frigidifontis]|uniref:Flagellar biosynthesis protein FlaG n=2 Tax=Iocasia fonsfrigidae TaxID=2682810 RepID=A0A8A7KDM6_9FIRM|nr:flagellar biosynthesis protein FlaG [Iocasia fonsfrigidae]